MPQILWMAALAWAPLRAESGDVESAHDYPGFPRLPGYVISDYDEDNPADFDFPVARPLPIDAGHLETVHVKGHRYVIRYELNAGARAPSLFQAQKYYEKLASDAGFQVEKNGASGPVTETFYRATATHGIWVYLEPAITVNILTVVESDGRTSPPPMQAETPMAPAPESPPAQADPDASIPPSPAPPAANESAAQNDDSLYAALSADGRVVLPVLFQPGKDEIEASSEPLIDRVVAMLNLHPDISLRIEGHTDNTGDQDDNLRLSAQRALAIRAMLVAASIDRKRLDAVGVGGLQPLASNITAAGRERNRRIELVLWKRYPAFHAPAPNGQNYYPGASASASEKPGL
jgi:outer membrane protein OmpA-like peptidoglycan-associated protein